MRGQEQGDLGREFMRMLGPAGPELGCDECFDQLDVYVELELTDVTADLAMPAMRAHLWAVQPVAMTTTACSRLSAPIRTKAPRGAGIGESGSPRR